MKRNRGYELAWGLAVVAAISGVIVLGTGREVGWTLVAGGAGVLVAASLGSAWRVTRSRAERPVVGLAALVAGTAALSVAFALASGLVVELPASVRVVTLAAGAQAFLLAIDVRISGASRSERYAVPFVGHAAVLFGSALILETGPFRPRAALLAYTTGFAALTIHDFWMRQRSERVAPPRPYSAPRHWEAVLLGVVSVGVTAATVVALTAGADPLVAAPEGIVLAAGVLAGVAAVGALGALAPAPPLPEAFAAISGTISTAIQHAIVTVVLLNVLLLGALLFARGAIPWVLGGYLALLVFGVLLEYAMVVHARRWLRSDDVDPPPVGEDAPVTLVVSAANEGAVWPESLDHNLEALPGIPVLLIPAAKSSDDTVSVAHEYRDEYPDRVTVVEGTSGSKAGDLNAAWEHVETRYALLLDADETVEMEFLARGLERLREDPSIGIVQGRKAARYPEADRLARFVSAERQHSTWIEHPFLSDVFGAAHFAGSAAIFRREVPPALDGWSPAMLTEDIELTIRLYTRTDWRVGYDRRMVARELNPTTVRALVRQRVRWARGWAQVTAHHGTAILRSWRSLGPRRTFGIGWLLFSSVSAPFYTVFPALFLLAAIGFGPTVPTLLAVGLALLLFPARGVSIGTATLHDPIIEFPRSPGRTARMLVQAYLWIPVGWLIQLHALYLQLAGAPGIWHVTSKGGRTEAYVRRRMPPARDSAADPNSQPAPNGGADAAPNGGADAAPNGGAGAEEGADATFEVYADAAAEHRFRLRHRNGRILADGGEGYASSSNVRRAIRRLRGTAESATVLRHDAATVELYRADGKWRWRLVRRNGRVLAESGDYTRRAAAASAAERLVAAPERFESSVASDDAGGHRWVLRSRNGRLVARSPTDYDTVSEADEARRRVLDRAASAEVAPVDAPAFEVYEDAAGEWRWRLRHPNGNLLLDSGEGYATRRGARDGVDRVRRYAPTAPIEAVHGNA